MLDNARVPAQPAGEMAENQPVDHTEGMVGDEQDGTLARDRRQVAGGLHLDVQKAHRCIEEALALAPAARPVVIQTFQARRAAEPFHAANERLPGRGMFGTRIGEADRLPLLVRVKVGKLDVGVCGAGNHRGIHAIDPALMGVFPDSLMNL